MVPSGAIWMQNGSQQSVGTDLSIDANSEISSELPAGMYVQSEDESAFCFGGFAS
jgi:hypothetical protein